MIPKKIFLSRDQGIKKPPFNRNFFRAVLIEPYVRIRWTMGHIGIRSTRSAKDCRMDGYFGSHHLDHLVHLGHFGWVHAKKASQQINNSTWGDPNQQALALSEANKARDYAGIVWIVQLVLWGFGIIVAFNWSHVGQEGNLWTFATKLSLFTLGLNILIKHV